MGRRAQRLGTGAAAVLVAVAVGSCRGATEVFVEARTNLPYRDGFVVSFTVGTLEDVERATPTTEAREPWGPDGFVGSLAVVPTSGSDGALAVKVVLGVDSDSRSCAPPEYRGCVVARRRIHYSPHERLRLPIALYVQCKNVACDAASTCNVLGQCVSATVDPATCGGERGCTVPGDSQADRPAEGGDAGALSGDGAAEADADADADAMMPDANTQPESGSDSAADSAASGVPGEVSCFDRTCSIVGGGGGCCYDGQGNPGRCVLAGARCAAAPAPDVAHVFCDGSEDCTGGDVCCVGPYDRATCQTFCGGAAELCHSSATCTMGRQCTGLFLNYYPVCQ